MNCAFRRSFVTIFALAAWFAAGGSAQASFHAWKFDEVFSNADGTVQFIEMLDGFTGENLVGGKVLKSNANTLTLPAAPGGNLPSSDTAGHHMLFATAGFGALMGGVNFDYEIPAHFFNPAGDTLTWAGGFDVKVFSAVPTDGIHSLLIPANTSAVNSPTNFAMTAGSVDLSPPPTGDYNGDLLVNAADYTVWRNTLGQSVAIAGSGADGNRSGVVDPGDYTYWKIRYGNPAGSGASLTQMSVPEPSSLVLMIATFSLFAPRRRRSAK